MRGPHERLKYDLRRVWECPVCGHCELTGGDVTTLACHCQKQSLPEARRFMRLRDDGVRRVLPSRVPLQAESAPQQDESVAVTPSEVFEPPALDTPTLGEESL